MECLQCLPSFPWLYTVYADEGFVPRLMGKLPVFPCQMAMTHWALLSPSVRESPFQSQLWRGFYVCWSYGMLLLCLLVVMWFVLCQWISFIHFQRGTRLFPEMSLHSHGVEHHSFNRLAGKCVGRDLGISGYTGLCPALLSALIK